MTCAKGNVPKALIVFIVDKYLYCNQFSQMRAILCNEASTLFVNSPTNENLLSLEGIVEQYISMENQNILLDKQMSFVSTSTDFHMQNTMLVTPTLMDNINLSSPMIKMFHQKRKDTPTIYGCKVAKKTRGRPRKNQVQGINTLLPSPSNKVDFESSSITTQSLVGNYALSESQISTDSVFKTLPNSSQCDAHLPLPSHISQPTEISPVAASNGETIVPCYNVISTNRVMVQPVK
ncbi:hypothetical protein V8G54_035314 [Vigna mungo]|uniref:Uncharacterized protein n=1 Tax=Vigna mungo TaxID=3915 RepID=A0AAQ3RFK6_VIGMU